MASFETISRTANKTEKSWTNLQIAQFEYFNPNGAIEYFNAAYDELFDAVDQGLLPAGTLLAYDAAYHRERLSAMVRETRVKTFDANYFPSKIRETADTIRSKIAEKKGD